MALLLTACGSDDEASGNGGDAGDGGNGGSIDVGILTSLSGPGAAAAAGSIRGAQARLDAYEGAGDGCAPDLDFSLVEADDTSSAQGALAGAQKLVQQDDVDALINVSAFFYGAAPFLTTQASTVPVIGGAWDGAQEWKDTDDNLFASSAVPAADVAYATPGEFLESQDASTVAFIGYTTPSSQAGVANAIEATEAVGLETGYTNTSVQIGSTDVGPLVLGILDSGADAVYTTINFDTSLALVAGLKQSGWDGTFVSPTGYGADLLASEPAVQIGQGVVFQSLFTPVEQGTEATEMLKTALQASGNESGVPGFYESQGWFAADLLLYGFEQAGCDAGREQVIATLQDTDDWDAGGLYPAPVPQTTTEYDEQCTFFVRLEGDGFVPIEGADPVCGGTLS
ncbi:ABC transporter substrate-binding protein [Blastococcus sp. URHD0036]|uniref:ABC transporter substrate-binding protein n=1 Tax=Blastococcus sp. URHD0036 TaxID=1380356 RepID=UPI0018CC4B7A|nr:ABC transporter substrate-binding protein [Blastococcus sp. URHD0036]